MARFNKKQQITFSIGESYKDIVTRLYTVNEFSSREISDYIFQKSKIAIDARSIQRDLKTYGIIRTYKDAFKVAIKRGTKTYDAVRKKIKSNESRHGISLKTRYNVFKRDNFRCSICGTTAQEDKLVLDHILPVVKGGTNALENLRVLCRACNHGKMLTEERI